MKRILLAILLLLLLSVAAAQGDNKKLPVTVTRQVDRTAIWVGDELRYTIRAVYEPNVEMVLDNFTKERLPLSPFVIRNIDIQHKDWAGGKGAVEISLTLTTFETGKTEITIPPVPLYYFVRELGTAKEGPVDSVAAPAMPIGLRSTLATESLIPRTSKAPAAPGLAWALLPLTLGLAGLLSIGAYGGWRTWQKWRPAEAGSGLSREAREKIVRDALTRLRSGVAAAGDDSRQWSGAMASALRGMAGDLYRIAAPALTPEELEAALHRAGAEVSLAAQTRTVLSECEALCYGKGGGGPALRGQLLHQVERLMQSPGWVAA